MKIYKKPATSSASKNKENSSAKKTKENSKTKKLKLSKKDIAVSTNLFSKFFILKLEI